MRFDENRLVIYGLIALLVVAAVKFSGQLVRLDAGRGQALIGALVKGQSSAQRQIAWDKLQAFGYDVGSAYRQLPEKERSGYRAAFIQQFGKGFAEAGGTVKAFGGWRVERRSKDEVVIAADYPSKHQTLIMIFSGRGRKKLARMEWKN